MRTGEQAVVDNDDKARRGRRRLADAANRTLAGAAGLATAALLGCASPPADLTGELDVVPPDAWTAPGAAGEDAVAGGWLHRLDDPVLPLLVEEALAQNRDFRAAAARLEAARAAARQAGADRLPQVGLSLDAGRSSRNFIGFPIPGAGARVMSTRSETFGASFPTSWEADLWGQLRDGHAAAIAEWQAAAENLRGARLSLAAQVAKAWFNALEAELQHRLAERTQDSFESNLEVVLGRFNNGIGATPALDLRLTRANVELARAGVSSAGLRRDSAVRVLEVLLGRYPAGQVQLVGDLPRPPGEVPAGLPAELLSRRPDIAAVERTLAAADRRLSAARKSLLPNLRLSASGGTSSPELNEVLNTDFKIWSLSGSLFQPLIQGGRIRAGIEGARAGREETLARFAQAALVAFREVEAALAAEVYLAEQATATRAAAEESGGAEELARDRYGRGLTDIITVLEAQRRYFNTQRDLIAVRNLRLQNRIDLHLALGGDFAAAVPDPGAGSGGIGAAPGGTPAPGPLLPPPPRTLLEPAAPAGPSGR